MLLPWTARQLYFKKAHMRWDTVTVVLLEKVMKEMHYTINNLIPIHKIQAGGYLFSHVVFKNPLKNPLIKETLKKNFDDKNRCNNIKIPLHVKKHATLD
jgi:hypothetical protein